MMPTLSDPTKSFLAFCAVLAVVLSNIFAGQNWTVTRGPVAAVADVAAPPVAASPPVAPAVPAPAAKAAVQLPEPALPRAAEAPRPLCDVDACTAAYRTFRASDCTYMPTAGVRRLCTKGLPETDNAKAEPAAAHCHIRACSEYYSSFNPSDCTYQPLEGPRRLCEK